jgi:hypothetical protein
MEALHSNKRNQILQQGRSNWKSNALPPTPAEAAKTELLKRQETQTTDTINIQNAQDLNIKHTCINIRMPRVLPVTRLSRSLPDTSIILMLLNIRQIFTSGREAGR